VKGFTIYTSNGKQVKSIPTVTAEPTCVICVRSYNQQIYVLCEELAFGKRRTMVVLNSVYGEIYNFPVCGYHQVSQFAICNDKFYVADPRKKRLIVHSTNQRESAGKVLSEIPNDSFHTPAFLSLCPPGSLIISDPGAHKVYKLDCRTDKFTWVSTAVTEPGSVCCDQLFHVLVWCAVKRQIAVLSTDTGKL